MLSFADLIQQGSAHAWLFIPSAILLGILHGLEPGHSKTMMAAFIVAVRGTVTQAILLGLAATASHTLVVWAIALGGLYLWQGVDAEVFEPYFQLASAAIIIAVAVWMLWRTWKDQQGEAAGGHAHDHGHSQHHDHGHVRHAHDHDHVQPTAQQIHQHDHAHDHGHDHHHDHSHDHAQRRQETAGLNLPSDGYKDAHERAHANDIRRRFSDRKVTTWQIIVFGLTGGLIPCPAAITVLLLCLQLKEFTLGFALVLCFSIGLAITLVSVGAVAALSVKHASSRWSWFSTVARRAPYFSSVLIIAVGVYVGVQGWSGLQASKAVSTAPAVTTTR